MTFCCRGKAGRLGSTAPGSVAPGALAAALVVLIAPAGAAFGADGPAAGLAAAPAVVELRLRAALARLLEDPARILEIGIKKPSAEVEQSKAELKRFFAGSKLASLAIGRAPGEPAGDDGRFGSVAVRIAGLTLMGMKIEYADFELRGLEVDPEKLVGAGELVFRKLSEIGMSLAVGEGALDAVSRNYRIKVRPGRFWVEGKRQLLILPIGFEAWGRLRFTPDGRIYFDDRGMTLNGLPLPGFFRGLLRDRINPIFDLRRYLGAAAEVLTVTFESIEHLAGRLRLSATARVDLATGAGSP